MEAGPDQTGHMSRYLEEGKADLLPSGSFAMTIPTPPAPPSGMIPILMEVKIANPLAWAMTLGGIFRITFFDFFRSHPALSFSSVTMPSTANNQPLPSGPARLGASLGCSNSPAAPSFPLVTDALLTRPYSPVKALNTLAAFSICA